MTKSLTNKLDDKEHEKMSDSVTSPLQDWPTGKRTEDTTQPNLSSDERPDHLTASGMTKAKLCPGSHQREKGKPNKSSPIAESGNRIHDALEIDDFNSLTDDGERDLAVRAAELRTEVIDDFFHDEPMFGEVEINHIKEQRLYGLEDKVSGRFDGMVLDGHRALLYDYKTGYAEPIDAQHNLQMRTYAVLVAENYEKVTEVTAVIIQPRIRPEISRVVYSEDDLNTARAEVDAILERAYSPDAPIVPGATQCNYCRAKAHCPEASKLVATLPLLKGVTIPDDKLPWLLDDCRTAKKIIDAIEERARELLTENPTAIPGYKLRAGSQRSEIIDPQKLFNRCNELHSILPHEFVEICQVKKSKLKELVKEATGQKGKGLDETMDSLLHGLVKFKTNRASLMRERVAISQSNGK